MQDFYVRSRVSGGGREMVAFELDWLEWLFGPVASVSAEVAKRSDIPADIDDTFLTLWRFADDLPGSLTVSVAYHVPGRGIEVSASAGQIIWDSRIHQVAAYTAADGKWQRFMETDSLDYGYDRMYIEELAHFIRAVQGQESYGRSLRDAQRMLRVLRAVERSAAEGRRLVLDTRSNGENNE